MLYSRYTNISRNIIKQYTNFNERTNTLLYKNMSHNLFSKGLMFLWCVRDGQGQTAILTQLLLLTITQCVIFKNPLSTSSTSWLGLLNRGSLRPTAPTGSSQSASWLVFLSPTDSTAAGICLYSFITLTCFRFFFRLYTQVHL